jgi:recombination protein RecT
MGKIESAVTKQNPGNSVGRPIDRLKDMLATNSVQEQFKNVLKENAGSFIASVIDLYNTDRTLQACDPKTVIMEAFKAASLKLPINKQLGFAWIVPYKNQGVMVPTFEIGYKGYIQLALRTEAYRYINGDVVYEGELVKCDRLTGEIEIDPEKRTGDKNVGYFAFLEILNGFRKTVYMSTEDIITHAKRFSKSFNSSYSPWTTDFDAMAIKTCFRALISKYGLMSIEMMDAFTKDDEAVRMADQAAQGQTVEDDYISVEAEVVDPGVVVERADISG